LFDNASLDPKVTSEETTGY